MQVNSKLIFDVGANTGSFSSLYCDDYSVIAIEANPVLAARLKQNPKFIELGYTKYAIKDLCGDFVPNSYEQYTRTNTYSTADEILAMNGYGLMSGMILAF